MLLCCMYKTARSLAHLQHRVSDAVPPAQSAACFVLSATVTLIVVAQAYKRVLSTAAVRLLCAATAIAAATTTTATAAVVSW